MFIATANSTVADPDPLLDRMEQLTLVGYTPSEKLQIAKRYLMPRQMKETGLGKNKGAEQAHIADGALDRLIAEYNARSGCPAARARDPGSVAKGRARGRGREVDDGEDIVRRIREVTPGSRSAERGRRAGRRRSVWRPDSRGRRWVATSCFIEAIRMPGKGQITLTGQLGDVMKESAQAAWSLLRARASTLGIPLEAFTQSDVICTSRPAASPRMVLRPASPSPRRSRRCCAAGRRATMSP